MTPNDTGQPAAPDRALSGENVDNKGYAEYIKVIVVTLLIALVLKTFVVEAYRIPSASMENTLLVGDFLLVNKLAYGLRTPRYVPMTNVSVPTLTVPFFGSIHREDVVVFEYPGTIEEVKPLKAVNFVKRCVGLPGDTVRIVHGRVVVNGATVGLPQSAKPADGLRLWSGARRQTLFPPGLAYSEYDYGPIVVPKRGDSLHLDSDSFSRWKIFVEREGHRIHIDNDRRIFVDGKKTDTYVVERNYYFMLGDNRDDSLDSRYWGFVPDANVIGEAILVYWSWDPAIAVGTIMTKLGSIRWNRIGTIIR
ncbi:MAG TPA: signal peptidase I [Bacteroidota bacterium]